MAHIRGSRRTGTAAAIALLGVIALSAPAAAANVTGDTDISCSAGSYESIRSVSHSTTTAMTFWADDADPASTTRVTAESSSGNWLPSKLVSEGSYAAWSSVLPSTYTFYGKRSVQGNCNGILPGDGNHNLDYTIVY